MATPKAAIYLRISDDQDGEQQATGRQREDCINFCERSGWEVAQVFEDVDYSGYSGKRRPGFEAMLEAVRDGTVHAVVAWKVDRFHRNLKDFVRLDEACTAGGAVIRTVADGVDTTTPAGQMVATMLVAQGRMESANTSTRVKRAMEQAARDGKPHVGHNRGYGYDRQVQNIIPEEAAVIREVVARALTREPMFAIASDLNRRGIKTTTGCEWRVRSLRRVITAAYISGQREYERKLSPGIWPAIITPEELRRVRAITTARIKRGRPAVSPLAGLVRCGICGEALAHWSVEGKPRRYRCGKTPGARNCGRILVKAESLEREVGLAVLLRFEGTELPAVEDDTATDAVIAIEASMAELAEDYYVHKSLTRAEFQAARSGLQDRLQLAQAAIAKLPISAPVMRVTAAEWERFDAGERRTAAAQVLEYVAVGPAPKLGNIPFDVSRLTFTWRL